MPYQITSIDFAGGNSSSGRALRWGSLNVGRIRSVRGTSFAFIVRWQERDRLRVFFGVFDEKPDVAIRYIGAFGSAQNWPRACTFVWCRARLSGHIKTTDRNLL
ncbi:MAG: hypothetical protein ACI9HK_000698 [Pirellulaceae bacterium]|jgi:hypothetical protein